MDELEIIHTPDGSSTLYLKELNETYHTVHGAVSESKHVYIENGLKRQLKSPIHVLEIGLGTGLNAWLTYQEKRKVRYFAIEPNILSIDTLNNYYKSFESFTIDTEFLTGITNDIGTLKTINSYFEIKIFNQKLEECSKSELLKYNGVETPFDVIYFDAFAPSKQKEIWDIKNLELMFSLLSEGGELVTYCSQGEFKRNLKKVGFKVLTVNGPLLKREMTIAKK